MMRLHQISIYPVKSLRGIELEKASLARRGLVDDRLYMLVDSENKLITQREYPILADVAAKVENGRIGLELKGSHSIEWEPGSGKNRRGQVTVWNSTVDALFADDDVNSQLSDFLGETAALVYMPEDSLRPINSLYNRGDEIVSFADGYPLLVTTLASLGELNTRLSDPVPMERFRPNIVIDGSRPFEEDGWKRIRVGETIFRVTKPCARCKVTTVDQRTGLVTGPEPLKTLAKFRRSSDVFPEKFEEMGMGRNDVLFGTNLVPENWGTSLSLDDEVELLD